MKILTAIFLTILIALSVYIAHEKNKNFTLPDNSPKASDCSPGNDAFGAGVFN